MLLLICSLIKTGIFKFNPPLYVEEELEDGDNDTGAGSDKASLLDELDSFLQSLDFNEDDTEKAVEEASAVEESPSQELKIDEGAEAENATDVADEKED